MEDGSLFELLLSSMEHSSWLLPGILFLFLKIYLRERVCKHDQGREGRGRERERLLSRSTLSAELDARSIS